MHSKQHTAMNWGAWAATMAIGLVALLVSGLLALWAQPIASEQRGAAARAASARRQPITHNRIFQDEIAAAAIQDRGVGAPVASNWPERLSAVRPATPARGASVLAQAHRPITNRVFLDEIAGALHGGAGLDALLAAEVTPQRGPR